MVKGGMCGEGEGVRGEGGQAWRGGRAWDTTRYGDTINERAVRILLECILVLTYFFFICFKLNNSISLVTSNVSPGLIIFKAILSRSFLFSFITFFLFLKNCNGNYCVFGYNLPYVQMNGSVK